MLDAIGVQCLAYSCTKSDCLTKTKRLVETHHVQEPPWKIEFDHPSTDGDHG